MQVLERFETEAKAMREELRARMAQAQETCFREVEAFASRSRRAPALAVTSVAHTKAITFWLVNFGCTNLVAQFWLYPCT